VPVRESVTRRRVRREALRRELERWERLAGPVAAVQPFGRCVCGAWLYEDRPHQHGGTPPLRGIPGSPR
jgi:hypothetical protein